MTIQRIQDEVNSLEMDEDRLILYHGSKSGIEG